MAHHEPQITLVARPPRHLGRLQLLDFPESPEFHDRWWSGPAHNSSGKSSWYSAFAGEAEIVRVRIALDIEISPSFAVVAPADGFVEIVLFEVAASRRVRGYGTTTIRTLKALYPDRKFAAFSEQADGFWGSLGWARYEHEEGTRGFRPLYVG